MAVAASKRLLYIVLLSACACIAHHFLVMFQLLATCCSSSEAQLALPWSIMPCRSCCVQCKLLIDQFCCSSLRVLIDMSRSDGSCSACISSHESDPVIKTSPFQILPHYQILLWQLPILIQTHYQIPPALPVHLVLRIVARNVPNKSHPRILSGRNAGSA